MTAENVQAKPIGLRDVLRGVWSAASTIGLVAGILSVVLLIHQGFDTDLRAPFSAVVGLYQSIVDAMLGWADAPLQSLLRVLGAALALDWDVHPHWKHVFVLMSSYLALQVRINLQHGKYVNTVVTLLLGPLLALSGSVGYGLAPLAGASFVSFAFIAPVLALVLYGMAVSLCTALFHRPVSAPWHSVLLYYLTSEVLATVGAGFASYLIGVWAMANGWTNPTLLALFAFILVLGLYFLGRGIYLGLTDRAAQESWHQRFSRSQSGRFGVAFFIVMGGATLFLLFNAGLPAPNPETN